MPQSDPIHHRSSSESGYFAQRAVEEQSAARHATCTEARERHEELAAMYRLRSELVARVSGRLLPPPATKEKLPATM